jgi:eukaryotic-like serine/threonine-protein kinase
MEGPPILMDELRFQRLQTLFATAVDLPASEWSAFARHHCAEDAGLHDELLVLLRRTHDRNVLDDAALDDGLATVLRDAVPGASLEGRRLGNYRVEGMIGDGGMGRVFRAARCDGKVVQQVAIKLVRGELLQPALLRRFSAEQQALAALNHPGICRFIDAGSLDDGTPFVVMELIEGTPLLQYCDERRLDIEQRLTLFRAILSAVDHAHRNLIVHRDIKSANVIVDRDGQPRLLDFGIAKALRPLGANEETVTSDRFFTPANAAPEQLRGEPVTVACDVYALGLLCYQLLTGKPAYSLAGLSAAEVELQLLRVPPPLASQCAMTVDQTVAAARRLASPRALARRLSGDIDSMLAKCVRKEPLLRYASVQQLDEDIVRLLSRRPIRARGNDRWYRAGKFMARHRLPLALGALTMTILVVALAVVTFQAFALSHQRNMALAERDRAQQVAALLKDVFVAADPARTAGADMRVRDVLEAAHPRLESLYESQPGVYAALAGLLAEVEFALGLELSSGELSTRAADAAETAGEAPEMVDRLLSLGALALAGAGRYDAALAAMDRVRMPERSPLWQLAQARLALHSNDDVAAIEANRKAVALTSSLSPDDELALLSHWQLADAYRLGGHHESSLRVLEDVLDRQLETLESGHPAIIRTRLRLAASRRRVGDPNGSIEEVNKVFADIERLYGPRNTLAALAHSLLALAHGSIDQRDESIAHHRKALLAWQAVLGDHHTNTLRTRFNLAQALAASPETRDEAEEHYRAAVAGADQAFGPAANATVYFRVRLASFELERNRTAEALRTLDPTSIGVELEHVTASNRKRYLDTLAAVHRQGICSTLVGTTDEASCAAAERTLAMAASLTTSPEP